MRAIAARILKTAGFEVVEAVDGLAATERWAEAPGVRCIVTDIVMPRRSGDELAERVWADNPDLPVLFTSGYTQEFRPDLISSERRAAFLQKPYNPEQLVAAIFRLIG